MGQSTCQKIDAVFSRFKCSMPVLILACLTGKKKKSVKKTVRKMLDAGLLVKDDAGLVRRPRNNI
jgi:predicted transcriptional regulator